MEKNIQSIVVEATSHEEAVAFLNRCVGEGIPQDEEWNEEQTEWVENNPTSAIDCVFKWVVVDEGGKLELHCHACDKNEKEIKQRFKLPQQEQEAIEAIKELVGLTSSTPVCPVVKKREHPIMQDAIDKAVKEYCKDVEDLGDGDGIHSINQVGDAFIAGINWCRDNH